MPPRDVANAINLRGPHSPSLRKRPCPLTLDRPRVRETPSSSEWLPQRQVQVCGLRFLVTYLDPEGSQRCSGSSPSSPSPETETGVRWPGPAWPSGLCGPVAGGWTHHHSPATQAAGHSHTSRRRPFREEARFPGRTSVGSHALVKGRPWQGRCAHRTSQGPASAAPLASPCGRDGSSDSPSAGEAALGRPGHAHWLPAGCPRTRTHRAGAMAGGPEGGASPPAPSPALRPPPPAPHPAAGPSARTPPSARRGDGALTGDPRVADRAARSSAASRRAPPLGICKGRGGGHRARRGGARTPTRPDGG